MTHRYDAAALVDFATRALVAAGIAPEPARATAEGLVESDLYGHTTHGLAQLAPYVAAAESGEMTAAGEPDVVSRAGAAETWDAKRLPGLWVTRRAVDRAVALAGAQGIGAVAIRRAHHIGCLASFLEAPARQGYVVLVLCSDPATASVAPYGGVTPVLTPDPIAAGIPGDPDPILVDISTATTSNGRVGQVAARGERLPGKWLLTRDGVATDDPAAAQDGATVLPLGGMDAGYKGFALGLLVECLSQGLAGHGRVDAPTEWGASVLVLAIAPGSFASTEAFRRQVRFIAEACHAADPLPGGGAVRLPGEAALARKAEALADGVPLHDHIVTALQGLAERLGVPLPAARVASTDAE